MKTGEDFRREFPAAEHGFEQAVQQALTGLPEKAYGRDHKLRTALLLAAVLILAATAGIAATVERWGISDFTEQSRYANLSDKAAEVVAADFEDQLLDTPYGTVTITEAIYDGMAVYLLMEVSPQLEGCMILPYTIMEGMQASSFGSGYPSDQSIQEYARTLGYSKLMSFENRSTETTANYYDSKINEDGTFSLMMWAYVRPEYRMQETLEMHFQVNAFNEAAEVLGCFETAFMLTLVGEVQRASSALGDTAEFASMGVNVTKVEAIHTPMTTYILVHCDIADSIRYNEYRKYGTIRFLNGEDEMIPKGAQPMSFWVHGNLQQLMGKGPYYITNRLFDEMPDQITIGEYEGNHTDGWTEGATYTFQLQ